MIVVHCSNKKNGRFPPKIALHLKKVCYKVSLCENSATNCKAFIGLTICAKVIAAGDPFYLNSLVAPQP